jgi:hypothetical protein
VPQYQVCQRLQRRGWQVSAPFWLLLAPPFEYPCGLSAMCKLHVECTGISSGCRECTGYVPMNRSRQGVPSNGNTCAIDSLPSRACCPLASSEGRVVHMDTHERPICSIAGISTFTERYSLRSDSFALDAHAGGLLGSSHLQCSACTRYPGEVCAIDSQHLLAAQRLERDWNSNFSPASC